MKKVVISLLGSTLDQSKAGARWDRWRPSVAITQHEDLLIDRYHLIYQQKYQALAEQIQADVASVSPETELVLENLEFADPWDFEEVFGVLHDYARNYPFNPDEEEYLIHITTGTHVVQICLFLLTESRLLPGKLLQASPPKKRRESVAGSYTIIDLDLSRYDRLAMRFAKQASDDISFLKSGIETRNRAFNDLIEKIEHVAIRSVDPILLSGPTGAGKSQLAKRIYELKKLHHQVKGPFVEVNCAILRGDTAMSTLFGHRKGAFTGAVSDRPGLLLTANNGILFLDEIGELGVDEQAMLLRAIEEKRFLPVGADQEETSQFQLICGTNRDLREEVRQGRFRDDLLARIQLWTFDLPGLKERPEDIEPNLAYELDKFASVTGSRVTFNREARDRFLKFAVSGTALWQANFRDLNGAITRMATLAPGGRINKEVVDDEIAGLTKAWQEPRQASEDEQILLSCISPEKLEELDLFDRPQLATVIRTCRQSRSLSDAGRTLFAASRRRKKTPNDADRLRKYLAKFGLGWEELGVAPFGR